MKDFEFEKRKAADEAFARRLAIARVKWTRDLQVTNYDKAEEELKRQMCEAKNGR
jgi:hypothetical protein